MKADTIVLSMDQDPGIGAGLAESLVRIIVEDGRSGCRLLQYSKNYFRR